MENKGYLVPNEVADLLMVSPVTVRQWAQKGLLRALTTAGGHRRFTREEVERFARERGVVLPRAARRGCRILIATADASLCRSVLAVLRAESGEIETDDAVSGFEAGLKISRFAPDVILLDLAMPGLDGLAACRRLKNDPACAGIRLVALAGEQSAQDARRAREAGADACLTLPASRQALLAATGVERLIERAQAAGIAG
jgi:excisionase family DNA binding protein